MHAYAEQFTSKIDLQEMWDKVQGRILEELEHEMQLMTADQHLDLSDHTSVFAAAMSSIGFESDTIVTYVKSSTGDFKEKLCTQLADVFQRYALKTVLVPSRVQSESDYVKTEEATFYCANPNTVRPPLPFEFAFSRSYVELCEHSKHFFQQFGAMSLEDDDVFDNKEVNDSLNAFKDTVLEVFTQNLDPGNMSVSVAVQCYIDMSYLVTKFASRCEAEWLVTECGAGLGRPAIFEKMLEELQPMFKEHLVAVITAQVRLLVLQAQAQIDWEAEEADSAASLNPSRFTQDVAEYFSTEVFVNLNRLEPERCGLKASEVERDRKEIEVQLYGAMVQILLAILEMAPKVTKVAFSAVDRDLQAIMESLQQHSKLRTLKRKECFAPITQLCKMLTNPGEVGRAVDPQYRQDNYESMVSEKWLVPVLFKYEAGLKGQMIGKTDDQKDVDALLKALGAKN
eukprot:TRINITY_DN3333_c0_g1_i8.p1 TRINITY_DN3333_c0_g1~~TRINITY_DN3333_c0_g1_i8.p1  ORF type:complete len:455 (-),score=121.75 TRINITY_DN3333_c0_g1_i8:281-1645(-)